VQDKQQKKAVAIIIMKFGRIFISLLAGFIFLKVKEKFWQMGLWIQFVFQ
jgi:hypothetical protein